MKSAKNKAFLPKKKFTFCVNNAQDHERMARHFDAKAIELEAESKEHSELAAQYSANPTIHESKHPLSTETAGHCQYFADDLH